MSHRLRGVSAGVATAAVLTVLIHFVMPLAGQSAAYRAPRTPDGKPDLNGIWQAMNEANYDLQMHMARPAMALRAGPYGPVPAAPCSRSARLGRSRPASASSRATRSRTSRKRRPRRKRTRRSGSSCDPEIKCFLPGVPRATYMPYPFQIFQSQSAFFIAYEYAGAVRNIYLKDPGTARRSTPGWASRSDVGKATRSSSTSPASTIRPGSIARATTTARSCTSWSVTRGRARRDLVRGDD